MSSQIFESERKAVSSSRGAARGKSAPSILRVELSPRSTVRTEIANCSAVNILLLAPQVSMRDATMSNCKLKESSYDRNSTLCMTFSLSAAKAA